MNLLLISPSTKFVNDIACTFMPRGMIVLHYPNIKKCLENLNQEVASIFGSILIDYELVEAGDEQYDVQTEGSKVAKPDFENLVQALRWCYHNQSETSVLGENAFRQTKHLTWSNTAQILLNLLRELSWID